MSTLQVFFSAGIDIASITDAYAALAKLRSRSISCSDRGITKPTSGSRICAFPSSTAVTIT
jgi:hypothetical protein